MNNIHYDIECNNDETDSDSDYTYDQPVDGIATIYFSIKTKDGINPFEGVLINLDEYLKKRCLNRFPNYCISTNKIDGYLDRDLDSKIIIEHGFEKNEFGIEIINCSEIQIPSWYLDQIYYIDNIEKFLKWMPYMVRRGVNYNDNLDKQWLKDLKEEAQKSEKYYINEIKSFPFLVANAYYNPGPMRKKLKKDFIPIINTINTLLNK